jgi:hypothetical protein
MEIVPHQPSGIYAPTGPFVHALEVRGPERLLFVTGTMGPADSRAVERVARAGGHQVPGGSARLHVPPHLHGRGRPGGVETWLDGRSGGS